MKRTITVLVLSVIVICGCLAIRNTAAPEKSDSIPLPTSLPDVQETVPPAESFPELDPTYLYIFQIDDWEDHEKADTNWHQDHHFSHKKDHSSGMTAYDEGYDDMYFNEDYDEERYRNNPDYAIGVDEALDDIEEDGEW